jgi:hypothetical protein
VGSIGGGEVAVVRASATGEPADAPPGTVGEPEGRGLRVAADDEWVVVERARRNGAAVDPASLAAPGESFEKEVAEPLPDFADRG